MSKRTLGIDVGLNGAIALVVDGELITVVDMPTVTLDRNGKAKRQVLCLSWWKSSSSLTLLMYIQNGSSQWQGRG
jgi:hypothetical protein